MSTMRRALSNTFYLINDWLVIMIFGYVFWIILAKLMSASDVGMFSTISNLAIFISVFATFGFNNAAAKLISSYLAKNMHDVAAGIIKFTIEKTILLTVILSIATFAVLRFVFPAYLDELGVLAVILFMIPNSLYLISQGVLLGLQDMKKIFITDLFSYIVKIIITIALIMAGMKYLGPTIAFAAAMMFAFFWRMRGVKIKKHEIDRKELWEYSKDSMIGTLGMILFFQSTIIILGLFRTFAEVGIFTLAFMLTTPVRAIFQSVSGSLLPMTSGKWDMNENEKARMLIDEAIRYSVFLIMPLLLMFIFFAEDILSIFAQQEYIIGASSMKIIASASLLYGLSFVLLTVLYSTGNPRKSRDLNMIGGVSNTIFAIALIPFLGMLGAAVSYLLASLITFSLSVLWSRKDLKVKFVGFGKILAAAAVFSFVAISLEGFMSGLPLILVGSTVGTLAYFSFLLYSRFFTEVDIRVMEVVETKIPKTKILFGFLKKLIKNRISG